MRRTQHGTKIAALFLILLLKMKKHEQNHIKRCYSITYILNLHIEIKSNSCVNIMVKIIIALAEKCTSE